MRDSSIEEFAIGAHRAFCGSDPAGGFRFIKLHEHTVETVAAARAAIGPDVALMVDTNCYWNSVEDAAANRRFRRNGLRGG